VFLARGRVSYQDVGVEDLRQARLGERANGAALFIIGPEHLEPNRGVVARDENDLPVLGLPGFPEIERDSAGRVLFYVWEVAAVP
jgi:hypothetical protein